MGGNAFSEQIPEGNFPRLSTSLYQSLRDRLLPTVQKFYTHACCPNEEPQKVSHGDIDFVVAYGDINQKPDPTTLKSAIGAEFIIADPMGTSNYALVVNPDEWIQHGGDADTVAKGKIYCQVDINVSPDKEQWERVLFMHSYGDLGMIMGLIVRNAGLHLGINGLKVGYRLSNLRCTFSRIFNFTDPNTWTFSVHSLVNISSRYSIILRLRYGSMAPGLRYQGGCL